jgi:tRNA (cytidine/uridine-2'-O-)-methyltransferase
VFEVVLVHPEIPPNTGNVHSAVRPIPERGCTSSNRSASNSASPAFAVRAWTIAELTPVRVHADWARCCAALAETVDTWTTFWQLTTKGRRWPAEAAFQAGDVLVFGCETGGLPPAILAEFAPEQRLRLPMVPGNRSINLSNAVAVSVYEAWRQIGYPGAA